jgi:hypothetical protein
MTTAQPTNLTAYPNLTPRPAKRSLNRGPIQVRARRALRALGEASTLQISEWAHPRRRQPAQDGLHPPRPRDWRGTRGFLLEATND